MNKPKIGDYLLCKKPDQNSRWAILEVRGQPGEYDLVYKDDVGTETTEYRELLSKNTYSVRRLAHSNDDSIVSNEFDYLSHKDLENMKWIKIEKEQIPFYIYISNLSSDNEGIKYSSIENKVVQKSQKWGRGKRYGSSITISASQLNLPTPTMELRYEQYTTGGTFTYNSIGWKFFPPTVDKV
jgi:hypothetical protein